MYAASDPRVVPSGTSIVFTTPAAAAAGKVLIVKLAHDSSDGTFSPPAGGWTGQQENDPSGAMRHGYYWLHLTAAPDATYTFTFSGSANMFLGELLVDEAPPGYAFSAVRGNITSEDSADGELTSPAVTGAAKGTLYCAWSADDNQASVPGVPAGMSRPGARGTWVDGASGELDTFYQDDPGTGSLTKSHSWVANTQIGATAVFVEYVATASALALILSLIRAWRRRFAC